MKKKIVAIPFMVLFLLILTAPLLQAASVALSWQPNAEPDLQGYNIYYGTESRSYGPPLPVGNVTNYTLSGLEEDTQYYFAVSAVDTAGNESGYSTEVTKNIPVSSPDTGIDYRIVWSPNTDHSNPVGLETQPIEGSGFIFLTPESSISQVVFSIDGQVHNTERYAPYDLGGGAFDTENLPDGTHTISAQVTLQDGSVQSVAADCVVQNGLF